MIRAIFFATFDVDEGPKLHHLLPESLPGQSPILDFKPLAPYLIPPPALCNTTLTLLTPTRQSNSAPQPPHPPHRILCHPVCISSESYPRNAFTFNFGLVLDAATEFSTYLPVVKKLATLFRGLEEQGRFLSKDLAASANVYLTADVGDGGGDRDSEDEDEDDDIALAAASEEGCSSSRRRAYRGGGGGGRGGGRRESGSSNSKIYALSEILLEDLNNYGETQIPLDDSNTLNLKLFPTYPPPPPLYAWHVPLATVPLDTLLGNTTSSSGGGAGWGGDLTMARILPYINGVNSLQRVSQLADADFKLVRKAVRHLLYYGCCLLLDIFAFGAVYAPTSTIAEFVEDREMQAECVRYVALAPFPAAIGEIGGVEGEKKKGKLEGEQRQGLGKGKGNRGLDGQGLAQLYLSLRQGLSVKAWCLEHPEVVDSIDIRRFITFGVIKGFLYRVHKYAIATSANNKSATRIGKGNTGARDATPSTTTAAAPGRDGDTDGVVGGREYKRLDGFLDGTHCFDEICTELGISERELMGRLKARGGEVQIISR